MLRTLKKHLERRRALQLLKVGQPHRALSVAPQDPLILAKLGLFHSALSSPRATDAAGAFAQARSALEQGDLITALRIVPTRFSRNHVAERHHFAFTLARQDPNLAMAWLMPEETLQAAALLLHAGMLNSVPTMLDAGSMPESPDLTAMRSSLAAGQGNFVESRRQASKLFARNSHKLAPLDTPIQLSDLLPSENAAKTVNAGPLVSVIMPAFNAAGTIATAISSVLKQTYRHLELILIDDGSTDRSCEIASHQAAGDTRLRIVRQPQQGTYAARNRGIAVMRGEFATFLDADDVMLCDKIEQQLAALQGSSAVATVSRLIRLDEYGRFMSPRIFPLIRHNMCSLFIRATALKELSDFHEVKTGADAEFENRIQLRYGSGAILRQKQLQVVASWREGSLTRASNTGILELQSRRDRISYRESWARLHAIGDFPRNIK